MSKATAISAYENSLQGTNNWRVVGLPSNSSELAESLSRTLAAAHSPALAKDASTLGMDARALASTNGLERDFLPVMAVPELHANPRKGQLSFSPLQEWEGYVTDISDKLFIARLVDITGRSNLAEEEAEFPLEDLSQSDLRLIKIGAVFRWTIGYQVNAAGSKRRVSQVVFRQLPQWSKSELVASEKEARRLHDTISWE